MNEAQIQAELQAKLQASQPVQTEVAPQAPEVNTDRETMQVDTPLDLMTGYKLADIFGVEYQPMDSELVERLKYIYDTAVEAKGSSEYLDVADYIRSIYSLIGARSANDPVYSVFQWLKLDATRRKAEREMQLYASGW